jgi:phytoene synthase
MFSDLHKAIFKTGSRTYFYSSLFFPKEVRDDVSILYAFVRKADNYVDALPQDKDGFNAFAELYAKTLTAEVTCGDPVIDCFIELLKRKRFEPKWVEAFLYAMELDTYKKEYQNIRETDEYIYGSAEVVGLMMARILGLPDAAQEPARCLGKAMQYINFIRDINEDLKLGRTYLPADEIKGCGLSSLAAEAAVGHERQFRDFIGRQIGRYEEWQKRAEAGYRYLPKRYFVPVRTAADMYRWTAGEIRRNPLVVYERVVKPSRWRVLARGLYNYLVTR